MYFKISAISTILVLLLVSATRTIYTESSYGQSFEDTKTIKTNTNYALSAPSITSDKYNSVAEIVLLNQILTGQSHGYHFLVGEVKNIGNDTAESVQIVLSVYDKNGNIIGTDNTYSNASRVEPEQKSTFKLISSEDNFKGMKYYILSLQWTNSDGSLGYLENAQIYREETSPKFLS